MAFNARRFALLLSILAVIVFAAVGGALWAGVYNVAADDPHTRPVFALIEMVRDRSITARAAHIEVPALDDEAMVRQGAGNYAAMCAGCHLAPGLEATELSRGLYPAPPVLAERMDIDPARDFWAIKHGIKASGMPAWGRSMEDEYLWGMVAFLQRLPAMDASAYRTLVDSSEGHSHGGGESGGHHDDSAADAGHPHATDAAEHPHGSATATDAHPHDGGSATADETRMSTHVHADGTVESHPVAPTTEPAEPEAAEPSSTETHDHHDHHDHEH